MILKINGRAPHTHSQGEPFIIKMCYLVVEHVNMLSHQFHHAVESSRRRKGACTSHQPHRVEISKRIKSLCTSKLCFNLFSVPFAFSGGIHFFVTRQQHHWCHMFSTMPNGYASRFALCAYFIHCTNANEFIKQFQTGKYFIKTKLCE